MDCRGRALAVRTLAAGWRAVGLALAVCVMAAFGGKFAWAEAPAGPAIEFDISAGPLAQVLDAYSAKTGIQILYDGPLAKDRRSGGVHGVMAPDGALRELLAGTGLITAYTKTHDVIIMLDAPRAIQDFGPPPAIADDTAATIGTIHVQAPQIGGPSPPARPTGLYARLVQSELQQTLLHNPRVVAGRYEAIIRIWLDSTGVVQQSQLVSTTLDSRLHQALLACLDRVVISQPPPADLMQPVSVRVSVVER